MVETEKINPYKRVMKDHPRKQIEKIAESIRENSKRFLADIDPEHIVTVSVGVASFPRDGKDDVALLHVVDDMLYKAKAQGKDRVCFHKKPK